MNKLHFSAKLTLASCALLLTACGGGSGSTSSSSSGSENSFSGQFLDSPVANVGYSTETQEGTTNADGEFTYQAGESVTFSIGEVDFPTVPAGETVTPLEMAAALSGSEVSSVSVDNDNAVVNIIRLLQSLDSDGDPDNGITILEETKTVADGLSATDLGFSADPAVFASAQNVGELLEGRALRPVDVALTHFKQELTLRGKSPYTGLWFVNRGSDTFGVLALLESSSGEGVYYHSNAVDGTVYGEYGSYTVSDSQLVYTNEVTNIVGAGFAGASVPFTLSENRRQLTLDLTASNEEGSGEEGSGEEGAMPPLTRINSEYNELQGMWQRITAPGSEEDVMLIVFTDDRDPSESVEDYKFVVFLPNLADSENGSIGMEYGTYTHDSSSGALTVNSGIINGETPLVTSDGITLTADVENDLMTLTITPGEGSPRMEQYRRK